MQLKLKDILTEQYRQGTRVLLVIDEAQNLDESVLELVRMLSNFETARDKLIQIILSGQPLLADNMGSEELLQLRQRVSIFVGLKPLNEEETALYIAHRLRVSGGRSDKPVFTMDALALIAQSSQGVPRNINNLCFNALSQGFACQRRPIDRDVVHQAIAHLYLGPWRTPASDTQQPEERRTLKGSPVSSWADTPAKRDGWFPRVTVAAVVFLAVGGVLFESHQWLSRAAPERPTVVAQPVPVGSEQPAPVLSGQSDGGTSGHLAQTASELATPVASAQPASPAAALPDSPTRPNDQTLSANPGASSPISVVRTQQSVDSKGTVLVTSGATLFGICVEQFGSCTAEILQQIHDLNPSLSNPDHIETGQILRMPFLATQSSGARNPSDEKRTQ
jgi:hypothetical protein